MSVLIQRLQLRNLLSFGPGGQDVELGPLNVLIGPNGSGKSNLVEMIGLLRATSGNLATVSTRGEGPAEWFWKGQGGGVEGFLGAATRYPLPVSGCPERVGCAEGAGITIHHDLHLGQVQHRFWIMEESIYAESQEGGAQLYGEEGLPAIRVANGEVESIPTDRIRRDQSVLAQFRNPLRYPELTYLADQYGATRLYRSWGLGPTAEVRGPQRADGATDFLEEDASNLGLIINDLTNRGLRGLLLDHLRRFYPGVRDLTIKILGGTVQPFLHEEGLSSPLPVTRLSDGTLRYLAMLCILCHPEPPPLICLEEPELGLHPDMIGVIAELLLAASERTQLVVTTHSDLLVSALSAQPETILVCEKGPDGTAVERLKADDLREWLQEYSLGELWLKGQIGGTRW